MTDWMFENVDLVPPITDDQIREMLMVMTPMVSVGDVFYRQIDIVGVDCRTVSYMWSPKPFGPELIADTAAESTIPTYHTFGAPVFFKPSLAEVLGAILRFTKDWRKVRYFSMTSDAPKVFGSYHAAKCMIASEMCMIEGGGRNGRLIPFRTIIGESK